MIYLTTPSAHFIYGYIGRKEGRKEGREEGRKVERE